MRKKKRKNFVFVLLLLLCLIIPFSSILAFAYVPSGHIFSDGSPVGYYYVNNSVGNAPCGVSYTNLINDAAAGWNNSGAGCQFTKTTGSTYKIYVKTGNFGNSGYSGKTLFYNSSSRNITDSGGSPTANYAYTIITLNDDEFDRYSSTLGGKNGVRAIVTHEMGHSLGLKHSSAGTPYPIMLGALGDKIITQEITYYKPQGDDVFGVSMIY